MAPSPQKAEFNMVIKRLSKAEYHSTWFWYHPLPWGRDDISISRDVSTVELQQVRNAIRILSGHRSLEVVNKHLQLAYVFVIPERAERLTSTRIQDVAAPLVTEPCPCFRFLDLPPEIREQVLDLLLADNHTSHWQHQSNRDYRPLDTIGAQWLHPESQLFPQIPRTCKQLLQEGLPILYGKKNFKDYFHTNQVRYGYREFSEEFLRTIGEDSVTLMNTLWLPGSIAVRASESSRRAKKTYMDLRGLLK